MNTSNIILIVEDSDEDFYATERAFKKSGIANNIYRCIDGEDALHFLFHKGKYINETIAPIPNLILLDLNLPKTDGKQVLETVKKNEKLREIPIIVLTTSSDDRDIDECYAAGANSYIQKPVDLNRFMESIQRLQDYWFQIVVLPRHIEK